MEFYCGNCNSQFGYINGNVSNCKCGSREARDNILKNLARNENYWGEIPQKEMQEILALAERVGWHEAIVKSLYAANYYVYKYASDESRADFMCLLDLDKTKSVLDFGCGWGNISNVLSKYVRRIYAVDSTFERVKFCEIRSRQAGNTNLVPIWCDDITKLPIEPGSLDVAILNGVLEWVGIGGNEVGPQQVQESFLKGIGRLLKPGGLLYIGIENRFGINYFMGALDHNGLKYTNLMPRRLADIVSQIKKGDIYRTYTYSYKGYKSILRKTGFMDTEIYWAWPQYRDMESIACLNDKEACNFLIKNVLKRRKVKVAFSALNKTGLLKYLVPAYSIVATRDICLNR